jgi:hypothetical protein
MIPLYCTAHVKPFEGHLSALQFDAISPQQDFMRGFGIQNDAIRKLK